MQAHRASQNSQSALATAELLAIGAELLVGETRDTNSFDLARALTQLGVEVLRMQQLPDDRATVSEAVSAGLERADIVITTGGLGPTPDDLTREAIAEALGLDVYVDASLEGWLREIWTARGLPFPETNLKQAWLVPGASALHNAHGTAPGWWVDVDDKLVIALPGPPREVHPMWEEQALPLLRARGIGIDRASRTLHLTGIGESMLAELIGAGPLHQDNPRIATYARADSVDVRISAHGDEQRAAPTIVAEAVEALRPRLEAYVYAVDEEGWPEAIGARIGTRSLAVAEVGTAGYLGLLLATTPWLRLARQVPDEAPGDGHVDSAHMARAARMEAGTDIGLAAVAYESNDDMVVTISVDTEAGSATYQHSVFRGGDTGRRRAANVAAAELWRRLADP